MRNPSEDAYIRLGPSRRLLHSTLPDQPGSLVFIDIEPPAEGSPPDSVAYLTKGIVGAPPGFFLQASNILLRWPTMAVAQPDLIAQARDLADLIRSRSSRAVRVGFVVFPLGEAPSIVWGSGGSDQAADRELLARARAAELHFLLKSGGGIWNPVGYHYALPSGEHTTAFVRLADAFKRQRDPIALATWLHQDLHRGLAVVTDSPTLLPLVTALELALRTNGLGSLQTVMLTDYSSNHFEVEHAVADIEGAGHVLGLVSVSSTGTTARRIAVALDRSGQSYTLDTLVSRGSMPSLALPAPGESPIRKPWIKVGDGSDLFARADVCKVCRDPSNARLVYIDPRSFEPMVLPRPDLITPAAEDANVVRELWQFYDRVKGVGVHAQPHHTTREFRSNRPRLAVRCYPHWLLDPARYGAEESGPEADVSSYDNFIAIIEKRVGAIAADIKKADEKRDDRFDPKKVDLFVTAEEDAKATGFSEFLAAVARGLQLVGAAPELVRVPRPHSSISLPLDPFDNRHNILVITLGSITGTTMQQILLGLHSLLPNLQTVPQIAGLVLHSRPENHREWKVLQNAYSRLGAIWQTPLPLSSPFDDEEALLGVWPEPAEGPAAIFYNRRLAFLNVNDADWEIRISSEDAGADPWASFWGMPLHRSTGDHTWKGEKNPRLRPGSFYGHRLRAVSTFAAVGSAMQLARLDSRPKSAPLLQQFEMPAILRSYFDPPIVASVLRWMEPHEAWWGARPEEAANVLAETFARADEGDRKVLLPEFLLAAALGKIPSDGSAWLIAQASHCVWCWENQLPFCELGEPWSDEEIGPVQLGLALIRDDHSAAGNHLQKVQERLDDTRRRLDEAGTGKSAERSLATAHLLWALDRFLGSDTEEG